MMAPTMSEATRSLRGKSTDRPRPPRGRGPCCGRWSSGWGRFVGRFVFRPLSLPAINKDDGVKALISYREQRFWLARCFSVKSYFLVSHKYDILPKSTKAEEKFFWVLFQQFPKEFLHKSVPQTAQKIKPVWQRWDLSIPSLPAAV